MKPDYTGSPKKTGSAPRRRIKSEKRHSQSIPKAGSSIEKNDTELTISSKKEQPTEEKDSQLERLGEDELDTVGTESNVPGTEELGKKGRSLSDEVAKAKHRKLTYTDELAP